MPTDAADDRAGSLHDAHDAPTPGKLTNTGAANETIAAPAAARVVPISASRSLAPGALLMNRYRLVVSLGRGGMGEVFRADDLELGQSVALKFLPPELSADSARLTLLRAEVASARQIAHPNVCRVFDLCRAETASGPLAFLCMEYIDGSDLASLLARIGRLPAEKAADVARQICFGLAAVHDAGFLHRDLKPANVMLDGRGRVRLADFGLAVPHASEAGGVVGTPLYMAPEVVRGGSATKRSDIYALGLVLYELFTGRAATPKVADISELRKHFGGGAFPPASPSSIVKDLPAGVDATILACLDPDPDSRPPSAIAVAARLPGGDPLAAALAAGQTPSPELVAESGSRGGLSIRAAGLALLGIAIASLAFIAATAPRTLLAWVRPEKSVEVLTDRARDIVAALGFERNPVDSHAEVSIRQSLLERAKDLPAEDHRRALMGMPGAFVFWYRQSQARLQPTIWDRTIRAYQPEHRIPGDLVVQMDTKGRLDRLMAIPLMWPQRNDRAPADPIPILFEAAGLDRTKFETVAAERRCPVDADQVYAWKGPARDDFVPVRDGPEARSVIVHTGLADGRAVYFTVDEVGAGPSYSEVVPPPPSGSSRVIDFAFGAVVFLLSVSFAILAARNLRSGRGDARGATRVALTIAVLGAIANTLYFDRLPNPRDVFILGEGYAYVPWIALQFWLMYVALEPTARRIWPHSLITWSRVLTGRVRDPRVGRDVLIGLLMGAALAAVAAAAVLAAQALIGLPIRPPATGGELRRGLGDSASVGGWRVISGLMFATYCMFVLLLGRVIFKTTSWAMVLALAFLIVLNTQRFSDNAPQAVLNMLIAVCLPAIQIRLGLLCAVAYMVAASLLAPAMQIGWDWSAPWGTIAWVPAAILSTLALAAAWIATTADRRALRPAPES